MVSKATARARRQRLRSFSPRPGWDGKGRSQMRSSRELRVTGILSSPVGALGGGFKDVCARSAPVPVTGARWEYSLPPRPQLVPRAPLGRRRSAPASWLPTLWPGCSSGRLGWSAGSPLTSATPPSARVRARGVGAGGEHPRCYGYQGREEVSNKGRVRPCPPRDLCAVFHPGHRSRALSFRGGLTTL